jgi:phenylacetate-CoA ligase
MLNWRKPLLLGGLRLTGKNIPVNLGKISDIEYSREKVEAMRQRRLTSLLEHAYETVPYYRDILEQYGVVTEGTVTLDAFEDLPPLTKDDIRSAGDRLHSTDPGPDTYTNTSGGTTGEPVEFVQDDHYWQWNVTNKIYYQSLAGKELGQREMKLWGSERDIQKGGRTLKHKLRNFAYNRRLLNSFKMSREDMRQYVEEINDYQPRTIWAYVESIHQLAQFVEEENVSIYSPEGIITTAGTLHEPVRDTVERVFDTTVHNQYGSREVGDIACECSAQEGLHVFSHVNHVEVVDDGGNPVDPGEEGHVLVTNLTNYSMPMIRYKIRDMAIPKDEMCSCGRGFPLLETVTGRVSDHFVTPSRELVHGEYFTHLFYGKEWVNQFQVKQIARDEVMVKLVTDQTGDETDTDELEQAIKDVMGDVDVDFSFQEEIDPSLSGKYRYTISEVA